MRFVAFTLALAGCHSVATPPATSELKMHVTLAAAQTDSDIAIASVAMHLTQLRAVSDRSAVDPRALSSDIDLGLGDTADLALPGAPPGLYSGVDVLLGSAADSGLDIRGVWNAARVHVTLTSTPFDVRCVDPVRLDPGQRAQLTVQIDPTIWFAGVKLGDAASDPDDNGVVISIDDNRDLAQAVLANVMASFTVDCAPQ
ncbi:MAG: hypothetical protein JWN44_4745 [Myxococcales bacterium]|nr:hypothetical protein [Myxococcales bacterium]